MLSHTRLRQSALRCLSLAVRVAVLGAVLSTMRLSAEHPVAFCLSDEGEMEPPCPGVCRDPGRPKKPRHKKPGDITRGDCPPWRDRLDGSRRAGNPHEVSAWAKPSVTHKYSGGYVGGGSVFGGRSRAADEGTWGLDYDGCLPVRSVFLRWTCGRKQGGEGAYASDGELRVMSHFKRLAE